MATAAAVRKKKPLQNDLEDVEVAVSDLDSCETAVTDLMVTEYH